MTIPRRAPFSALSNCNLEVLVTFLQTKNSLSKDENQEQTQSTCNAWPRMWTLAKLVGRCANPAHQTVFLWVYSGCVLSLTHARYAGWHVGQQRRYPTPVWSSGPASEWSSRSDEGSWAPLLQFDARCSWVALVSVSPLVCSFQSSSSILSCAVGWKVRSLATWSWCCTGMTSTRCLALWRRSWPCWGDSWCRCLLAIKPDSATEVFSCWKLFSTHFDRRGVWHIQHHHFCLFLADL